MNEYRYNNPRFEEYRWKTINFSCTCCFLKLPKVVI